GLRRRAARVAGRRALRFRARVRAAARAGGLGRVLLLLAAVTRPGAGVVRHVPARALQLEARAGDESLDLPPALRAPLERRIGDALHLLEDAALLAAVLVDRHDGRLIMPRRRVNGKRRTQPGPDRRGIEA